MLAADLFSASRLAKCWIWLFAALGGGATLAQETHHVPLFPAAADANHEGFVRVINRSREAGQVEIAGFDAGGRKAGPVTLMVGAGQTAHFNSGDFERGNPAKGIAEGAGAAAEGDWRLALTATLDLEVNAYVRAPDGFLTSVVDVAPQVASAAGAAGAHRIGFFNPGGNTRQRSRLRIVNMSGGAAAVSVYGVDDNGDAAGPSRLLVPTRGSRGLDAVALEADLGDGQGKWRLMVRAEAPLLVMSLLESPTGHLANLSAGAIRARRQNGERLLRVPFFPAAGAANVANEGFVRVVNPGVAGAVRITAVDDVGDAKPSVALSIGAGRTVHFNSTDLAEGNPAKGLPRGVGAGVGDWRLELRTTLPTLEAAAYLRTPDGFVTAMHDVVSPDADVAFFNPGGNRRQRSLLRLVNEGAAPATVRLTGVDDAGERGGEVAAAVPARGATTLDAAALESGEGLLAGALGDGVGKWRLTVAANQPIVAMSLLDSPAGPLTNLSATSRKTAAELFRAEVAVPVVVARCVRCHVSGGAAAATRLVFRPATETDHAERNWQALTRFFRVATDAKTLLTDKPRGRADHGGGTQLEADSNEHANWVRLLGRMDAQFAWLRASAAPVVLVDAIPAAGREVDPGTGHMDVVHLGTPGTAYRYPPPCSRGVAVRRSVEAAADADSDRRRELVDHKLECELPAGSSVSVRVRGTGPDGGEIEAALPLNTSGEREAAQVTVRDRRALPSAEVNELFDRYIEDILMRALDSDVNRLLLAVAVDLIARRTWAELREPGARYPVVTESVSYTSRNPFGERSNTATGLVARPEIGGQANFTRKPRVVVLAHATGATPSSLSFADAWHTFAAMLAGRGYLVVAADNWGRGALAPDGQPETYLLTNRTANSGVDLLRAVLAAPEYRAFHDPEAAEADVSIIGYSQGGHTAVALWLALHTVDHGVRVRELHSGAGPHNLRETFLGVLRQVAGECDGDDGDEWCRHVNRDIVLQYLVGRVLPALFAYTAPALSPEEVLGGAELRPEFVTGMLRGEARYDTLSALLALNSHTNIIAPERAVRAGTEIHLYHAEDDRLVPEANTRELNALLKPRFNVTYHDDECESAIYRILTDVVDRVGALHALCGIEVLDDILKRFP